MSDTDSFVLDFGHEKYKIKLPEIGLYQLIEENYKNISDICSLVIKKQKYDFKITMEFRPKYYIIEFLNKSYNIIKPIKVKYIKKISKKPIQFIVMKIYYI